MADPEDDIRRTVRELDRLFIEFFYSECEVWSATPGNLPPMADDLGSRWYEVALERKKRWKEHITPLAEAWWQERGFKIIWPANDGDPPHVLPITA